MITEADLRRAREQFETAARDLGFSFISPAVLTDSLSAFAYLPDYGSPNGTVICLTSSSERHAYHDVISWCQENGFFWSVLSIEPLLGEYHAAYFREMLRDWGRF